MIRATSINHRGSTLTKVQRNSFDLYASVRPHLLDDTASSWWSQHYLVSHKKINSTPSTRPRFSSRLLMWVRFFSFPSLLLWLNALFSTPLAGPYSIMNLSCLLCRHSLAHLPLHLFSTKRTPSGFLCLHLKQWAVNLVNQSSLSRSVSIRRVCHTQSRLD